MAVINKEIAYMALPMSIRRGNPFPVDEYSVWYDMEELNVYAQSSPVSYVGQVVVYVNEDANTVEAYVIQNTSGTLTKLAATTASGDLTQDVQELQGKVSALETSVGTKSGDSTVTATSLWAAIDEIVAAYKAADSAINANLSTNYYDKTATDSQIDSKIATAISSTYKPAGSTAFESLPEPSATIEGNVYNITNEFTAGENFVDSEVGNTYPAGTNIVCIEESDSVFKYDVLSSFIDTSELATTTQLTEGLAGKVDKVEGSSLVSDTLITKLTNLATINEVNTTDFSLSSGTLNLNAINQDKVTGLTDALAGKISTILANGTLIEAVGGVVNIPLASNGIVGLVTSSTAENNVAVNAGGTMTVNSLNINKLVQTDGELLILDGGDAGASQV